MEDGATKENTLVYVLENEAKKEGWDGPKIETASKSIALIVALNEGFDERLEDILTCDWYQYIQKSKEKHWNGIYDPDMVTNTKYPTQEELKKKTRGVPLYDWWLMDSLCCNFRNTFVDGLNRGVEDYYQISNEVLQSIIYDNSSQLWHWGTPISVAGLSVFRKPGHGLAEAAADAVARVAARAVGIQKRRKS